LKLVDNREIKRLSARATITINAGAHRFVLGLSVSSARLPRITAGWLCRSLQQRSEETGDVTHAAQQARSIPSSIAIDDIAAVMYVGTSINSVFSWRTGSTAYQTYRECGTVLRRRYRSNNHPVMHTA
jgi:hypothetical protein